MKIVMPYIGKALSVNYYKIVGRRGVKTNKTRPEVESWMEDLAGKVQEVLTSGDETFSPPITISVFGKFVDGRCPDLSNLHKVVGDAVAVGLDMNDKNFEFNDLGYSTGYSRPVLEIEIKGRS